jgi:NAD(P)-dependent dehydrogenase (short-subunit alcohol dehydrogenase family)
MSKGWFITGASSGIGLGLARFAAHLRRNPNGDAVNNALLNKLEIDSPLKPGTPVRSGLQSNSQRYIHEQSR